MFDKMLLAWAWVWIRRVQSRAPRRVGTIDTAIVGVEQGELCPKVRRG